MDRSTAQTLLAKIRATKQADTDFTPFVEAVHSTVNQNLQQDALADLKKILLLGVGTGAAARGLAGVAGLFARPAKTRSGPNTMMLPYPVTVADDPERQKRVPALPKFAGLDLGRLGRAGGRLGKAVLADIVAALQSAREAARTAAPDAVKTTFNTAAVTGGVGLGAGLAHALTGEKTGSFLGGDAAVSKGGIPWYWPATMLGGLGALYGGWKGVDAVLDARRKKERTRELTDAQSAFHDALIGQFDAPVKLKTAAASLAADLDAAHAGLFKVATLGDLAGQATGMYGTYAGLTALAAGIMAYQKARKRQRRSVLEAALNERERRNYLTAPPELAAVPEPVKQLPKPSFKEQMALVADPTGGELKTAGNLNEALFGKFLGASRQLRSPIGLTAQTANRGGGLLERMGRLLGSEYHFQNPFPRVAASAAGGQKLTAEQAAIRAAFRSQPPLPVPQALPGPGPGVSLASDLDPLAHRARFKGKRPQPQLLPREPAPRAAPAVAEPAGLTTPSLSSPPALPAAAARTPAPAGLGDGGKTLLALSVPALGAGGWYGSRRLDQ